MCKDMGRPPGTMWKNLRPFVPKWVYGLPIFLLILRPLSMVASEIEATLYAFHKGMSPRVLCKKWCHPKFKNKIPCILSR